MAEIPEAILRRSAEARAAKEGRDVEEVLAEMKGEAPAAAADEPAASTPVASTAPPAPAASRPLPWGNLPQPSLIHT